jgi:hypothetical protein
VVLATGLKQNQTSVILCVCGEWERGADVSRRVVLRPNFYSLCVRAFYPRSCHLRLCPSIHTHNRDMEKSSGQAAQFNIWTIWAIFWIAGPQLNLRWTWVCCVVGNSLKSIVILIFLDGHAEWGIHNRVKRCPAFELMFYTVFRLAHGSLRAILEYVIYIYIEQVE